ncbi:hypothetical protein N7507_011015 [Penicillium longicatenatum]|nr:hypothetical protein N7507_011015 [Penicillium longicatenatum]
MGLLTPFVPYHSSAGSSTIRKFGGLLTVEWLEPPPGRSFMMRQTYRLDVEGPIPSTLRKLIDSPQRPDGPAMHFHRYQNEFFHVEHGICVAEVDGVCRNLTPEDGEVSLQANHIHRFSIHPDSGEYMTVLLSGSDAGIDNQLDRVFFENWYGYWHDALLYEGGLDFIQKLQMLDAGGHYTPAPAWMPFRLFFGYWTSVVIGRWLGGLLGYKPFFKEYTTDWEFAVTKMKSSFWTRRLVDDFWGAKERWDREANLSTGPKPTNAELQYLLEDVTAATRAAKAKAVEKGLTNGTHGSESNGFVGAGEISRTEGESVIGISSGLESQTPQARKR